MGLPKPLVPIDGIPLIQRTIEAAFSAGVRDFVIVTGHRSHEIETFLFKLSEERNLSIATVFNPQFEKENGLSVLCAKESLKEPFFLLMADHIVDPKILRKLKNEPIESDETILAVDLKLNNNPNIDIDDVTKVLTEQNLIVNIGKTIPEYNAFDTGIFLCTPTIFNALEESAEEGDNTLSGGIRKLAERQKARTMGIGNGWWIDVDDESAYHKAGKLVGKQRQKKQTSGVIKRTARTILTILGFGLLAYLVLRIGIDEIAANLAKFGYWFLLICLLGTGWLFFQSLSWNIIQRVLF